MGNEWERERVRWTDPTAKMKKRNGKTLSLFIVSWNIDNIWQQNVMNKSGWIQECVTMLLMKNWYTGLQLWIRSRFDCIVYPIAINLLNKTIGIRICAIELKLPQQLTQFPWSFMLNHIHAVSAWTEKFILPIVSFSFSIPIYLVNRIRQGINAHGVNRLYISLSHLSHHHLA